MVRGIGIDDNPVIEALESMGLGGVGIQGREMLSVSGGVQHRDRSAAIRVESARDDCWELSGDCFGSVLAVYVEQCLEGG